jgi:hypothetical protein
MSGDIVCFCILYYIPWIYLSILDPSDLRLERRRKVGNGRPVRRLTELVQVKGDSGLNQDDISRDKR